MRDMREYSRLRKYIVIGIIGELEYLAVYGRASMGAPVGELQYGR